MVTLRFNRIQNEDGAVMFLACSLLLVSHFVLHAESSSGAPWSDCDRLCVFWCTFLPLDFFVVCGDEIPGYPRVGTFLCLLRTRLTHALMVAVSSVKAEGTRSKGLRAVLLWVQDCFFEAHHYRFCAFGHINSRLELAQWPHVSTWDFRHVEINLLPEGHRKRLHAVFPNI